MPRVRARSNTRKQERELCSYIRGLYLNNKIIFNRTAFSSFFSFSTQLDGILINGMVFWLKSIKLIQHLVTTLRILSVCQNENRVRVEEGVRRERLFIGYLLNFSKKKSPEKKSYLTLFVQKFRPERHRKYEDRKNGIVVERCKLRKEEGERTCAR